MLWNVQNGQVCIGNTQMQYVAFGYGKKSLIILPGLSDSLATVKGKALLLARPYQLFFKNYTVYMFSRKNEMPEGYSIRDMAEDQAQALQKLGLSSASVMGVSQGGMIAQCLSEYHPDLVEKLVIAVSAPCVNETIRGCVNRWIEYAKQGDHKGLMVDTAEKSYSPAYLKKYRTLYPIIGLIGRPKDYGRFLINADAILNFGGLDDLSKIKCPTLIIGGTADQIVGPDASYEMHEQIAGSRLYMYEGLGHAAYEEADDFNQRVYEFLRSQRGGHKAL